MRLCIGRGSYADNEACLMSAAAYYAGENTAQFWTDHPECVAPEIATIGIALNDACRSHEEREELCGDLVFLVQGTRTDDPAANAERLRILREFAFDRAIDALESAKVEHNLRPFSEYPTVATAVADIVAVHFDAIAAAKSDAHATTSANAARAAASAARAAGAHAARAAGASATGARAPEYSAADAAAVAADSAVAAADFAASAADTAADAAADAGTGINARRLRLLRQLMLDLIAVGDRKEIVPVMSKGELTAWCNND